MGQIFATTVGAQPEPLDDRLLVLETEKSAPKIHLGTMRQFEAFLQSLEMRAPPGFYERLLLNAAILHAAERHEFDVWHPAVAGWFSSAPHFSARLSYCCAIP